MRARFRMRHQGSPKQLTRVGFEPTPPKGLVPKTSALDRSAISPYILVEGSSSNGIPRFSTVPHACQISHEAPGLTKTVDESGIRTHAPEGTGALNQRLGPLGHLAIHTQFRKAAVQMEFLDFPQFHMRARFRMRHQGSPKQLTREGFEPTPPKGLVPKTSALDRSAISPHNILVEGSSSNGIPRFSTVPHACQNSHEAPGLTKTVDESGIRTHAPEGTGA
ncbi:hypothetical protein RB195_015986 [Necator americanus]|uniref:Uncharacterized protein n=1 Tax=Necator americanus TaxID=51031 RepID=A0ABR1E768_NECAM